MADHIEKGTWVEIHCIVLSPEQRAAHVPDDTRRVPFEMRVKGFLAEPALVGDEAEIVTSVGRRLRGRLSEANPAYDHSFGRPVPELSTIGRELREILRERGRKR